MKGADHVLILIVPDTSTDLFLPQASLILLWKVYLDRHLSDHRPILLREVNVDFGPMPFRFYHSWFDYVGFDDMIKSAWSFFAHSDG
nr:RNA-directed DNA polymerase, eukaryota [Tanacetum cinerariifolium]